MERRDICVNTEIDEKIKDKILKVKKKVVYGGDSEKYTNEIEDCILFEDLTIVRVFIFIV